VSATAAVSLVLSNLEGVRPNGGKGFAARCPAHEDRKPSLSVTQGDDGRALIHCHAGCGPEAVVSAMGLRMADIMAPKNESTRRLRPARVPSAPALRKQSPSISVSDLAREKSLSKEFLAGLGLEDRPGGGVVIPYRLTDESLAPRQRLRTALSAKEGSRWLPGNGEIVPYGLDRLVEGREEGFIVLVEGESDCWTLWHHGIPALGIPGATQAKSIRPEHLVGIAQVYYWREPDQGGDTFAAGIAARLAEIGYAGEIREMRIAGEKDPNSLHQRNPEGFYQAFCKAIGEAPLPGAAPAKDEPVPLFTKCMADIEAKPVTWLWKDRLPLGKLAVIAGEPGLGKSRLALSLAATTSNGGHWPRNEGRCARGEVLILNFEDDPADTTVPRLTAEGADLSAIHQLIAVPDEKGRRAFDLSRDTDRLAKYLELHPQTRLVIVDPITACMGQTDSHKNAEVRAALHPLAEVAQRFGVCVLAITHLNKGTGMKAMHRVTGSIAFTAAARVVFAVARDEADPDGKRRLFVPVKNNLGNDQTGLSYGTDVVRISPDIVAPRIAWGDEVTISADEALSPPPDEERGAMEEACEFLTTLLAEGPVAAEKVMCEARGAGVAPITLKRAKRAVKVKAAKTGMRGGWEWSLP